MLCFICTDLTYSQTLCHVKATGSVKFSLGAHALLKRIALDVNNSRPHEQVPCAHAAAAAYEIIICIQKSQPELPGPMVGSYSLICTLRYSK